MKYFSVLLDDKNGLVVLAGRLTGHQTISVRLTCSQMSGFRDSRLVCSSTEPRVTAEGSLSVFCKAKSRSKNFFVIFGTHFRLVFIVVTP